MCIKLLHENSVWKIFCGTLTLVELEVCLALLIYSYSAHRLDLGSYQFYNFHAFLKFNMDLDLAEAAPRSESASDTGPWKKMGKCEVAHPQSPWVCSVFLIDLCMLCTNLKVLSGAN